MNTAELEKSLIEAGVEPEEAHRRVVRNLIKKLLDIHGKDAYELCPEIFSQKELLTVYGDEAYEKFPELVGARPEPARGAAPGNTPDAEFVSELLAELEPKTEAEPKAGAAPEPEAAPKHIAEPETKPEPEAKPEAAEAEAQTEAKPEAVGADDRAEAKPEAAGAEAQTEAKPEAAGAEAQTEANAANTQEKEETMTMEKVIDIKAASAEDISADKQDNSKTRILQPADDAGADKAADNSKTRILQPENDAGADKAADNSKTRILQSENDSKTRILQPEGDSKTRILQPEGDSKTRILQPENDAGADKAADNSKTRILQSADDAGAGKEAQAEKAGQAGESACEDEADSGNEAKPSIYDLLEEEIMKSELSDSEKTERVSALIKLRNKKACIMLTGATGCGKSSTINALFNMEVAKVGVGVDPETSCIAKYELENLTIYDTPGLGDSVENDKKINLDIIRKLNEMDEEGNHLIDMVVVILDASSRDLGTSYELINNVLIPCIGPDEANERILIALNQSDMAMKGNHWDAEKNEPDVVLKDFLSTKAASVQRRIRETTGIDMKPVCYCAGYKEPDGEQRKPYNLTKLLYFLVKAIPKDKRLVIVENLNTDKDNWLHDDKEEKYTERTETSILDDVLDLISECSDTFGEKGESILGAPGRVVGTVVGGAAGAAAALVTGVAATVAGIFESIFGY